MKIDRDSWHFKLVERRSQRTCYNYGAPDTLCEYFWVVVKELFMISFKWISIVLGWSGAVIVIGSVLNFLIVGPYEGQGTLHYLSILLGSVTVVLLAVGVAFAALVGILTGLHVLVLHIIACRKYPSKKVERKPNLVVEYIKAKKNKVCPVIEYTKRNQHEG